MRVFDLDFNSNMNFNRLIADIMRKVDGNDGTGILIYNSSQLLKMVRNLPEHRRNFFLEVYGLDGKDCISEEEFAEKYGKIRDTIATLKKAAFKDIAILAKLGQIIPYPFNQLISLNYYGIKAREGLDDTGKKLYGELLNIINSSGCVWESERPGEIDNDKKEETIEKLQNLQDRVLEIVKPEIKANAGIDFSTPIDVLDVANIHITVLKRMGKNTLGDLIDLDDVEVETIPPKSRKIIKDKRDELKRRIAETKDKNDAGLDENDKECSDVLNKNVRELAIPSNYVRIFLRKRIYTIDDLFKKGLIFLREIPEFDMKAYIRIVKALEAFAMENAVIKGMYFDMYFDRPFSQIPIQELGIPTNTMKILIKAGINNAEELAKYTKEDLVEIYKISEINVRPVLAVIERLREVARRKKELESKESSQIAQLTARKNALEEMYRILLGKEEDAKRLVSKVEAIIRNNGNVQSI